MQITIIPICRYEFTKHINVFWVDGLVVKDYVLSESVYDAVLDDKAERNPIIQIISGFVKKKGEVDQLLNF